MNAYELADKLDKSKAWLDSLNTQYKNGFGKYCLLPNEVALMLRQQADRIAELSKNIDELKEELLKAPQIKELSDEEIYKLAEYHGLNDWLYETSVPDFARAILKKASEK
jgi:archaellum component FlaC